MLLFFQRVDTTEFFELLLTRNKIYNVTTFTKGFVEESSTFFNEIVELLSFRILQIV